MAQYTKSLTGTLRFLASLTRFLKRSKTLTGSLRISGKTYVLREALYYGAELGTWETGGGVPGGSDTYVQYNDGGALGGM